MTLDQFMRETFSPEFLARVGEQYDDLVAAIQPLHEEIERLQEALAREQEINEKLKARTLRTVTCMAEIIGAQQRLLRLVPAPVAKMLVDRGFDIRALPEDDAAFLGGFAAEEVARVAVAVRGGASCPPALELAARELVAALGSKS